MRLAFEIMSESTPEGANVVPNFNPEGASAVPTINPEGASAAPNFNLTITLPGFREMVTYVGLVGSMTAWMMYSNWDKYDTKMFSMKGYFGSYWEEKRMIEIMRGKNKPCRMSDQLFVRPFVKLAGMYVDAPITPIVFVFRFDQTFDENKTTFDDLAKFVNMVLAIGNNSYDRVAIIIASPGGSALEFMRAYEGLRKLKRNGFRTYAFVDGMCASGGYMLACACNMIFASEFSHIGSVGTFCTYMNCGGMGEKIGIEEITLKDGAYKAGVPTFARPSEEDLAHAREELRDVSNVFKKIVIRARQKRNMNEDTIFTARMFYASDALKHGLIDGITEFETWVSACCPGISVIDVKPKKNKLWLELFGSGDSLVKATKDAIVRVSGGKQGFNHRLEKV